MQGLVPSCVPTLKEQRWLIKELEDQLRLQTKNLTGSRNSNQDKNRLRDRSFFYEMREGVGLVGDTCQKKLAKKEEPGEKIKERGKVGRKN